MTPKRRPTQPPDGLFDELFAEVDAMAKYALASGLRISPSDLYSAINPDGSLESAPDGSRTEATVRRMAEVHHQLAKLIAPATPRTILLLSRERKNARLSFLGPVRLVRQMMLVSIISLTTFVLTALSPLVNDSSGDIFRSSGWELFLNEVFLLSAAAIGAAFGALFQANRYIATGTYDPKFEASYWVRFVLGLIAGIVLPALIPVEGGHSLSKPLLALLGGFSASVVYRIMSRLVDTLESLVEGDARDALDAQQEVLRAQLAEQRMQDQLRLAGIVVKLRDQLNTGTGTDDLRTAVTRLLDELAPFARPGGDPPPSDDGTPPPIALK